MSWIILIILKELALWMETESCLHQSWYPSDRHLISTWVMNKFKSLLDSHDYSERAWVCTCVRDRERRRQTVKGLQQSVRLSCKCKKMAGSRMQKVISDGDWKFTWWKRLTSSSAFVHVCVCAIFVHQRLVHTCVCCIWNLHLKVALKCHTAPSRQISALTSFSLISLTVSLCFGLNR